MAAICKGCGKDVGCACSLDSNGLCKACRAKTTNNTIKNDNNRQADTKQFWFSEFLSMWSRQNRTDAGENK